eukprot:4427779-Heterocapsa_arctica.AAC.1
MMNISRDTLQHSRTLCVIKRNLVNGHLDMLAVIAMKKDNYKKFYDQLHERLKLNHKHINMTQLPR